jgi:hypothetical protein
VQHIITKHVIAWPGSLIAADGTSSNFTLPGNNKASSKKKDNPCGAWYADVAKAGADPFVLIP